MRIIAVILLCSAFLIGCGNSENALNHALELRQQITGSEICSFDCLITADYSNKIYTFLLNCSFDRSGMMSFTVMEPESISGISGTVDAKSGKFTFDGQILMFPLLADGYISPVSTPWIVMKTLRGGYIHSADKTDEGVHIIYNDSFEQTPLQVDIWTDEEINPEYGEILWQGRKILSMQVSNFYCV